MKTAINKRVREFLDYKKISQEDLRKEIGIRSKQQVSNWFSGADKIPEKHLITIIRAYPELNANWVINGSGEMLNDKSEMVVQAKGEYGFCEECLELKGEIRGLEKMLEKYQDKNQKLNQKVGELVAKLEDCNEQLNGNGNSKANVG